MLDASALAALREAVRRGEPIAAATVGQLLDERDAVARALGPGVFAAVRGLDATYPHASEARRP